MSTKILRNVFEIIGTCVLAILLYIAVCGNTGRTIMWRAIKPALQNNWSMYTYQDGTTINATLSNTFSKAKDLKTN